MSKLRGSSQAIDKRRLMVNSAATVVAHVVNLVVLFWVLQHLLKRIPAEEFALLPVVSSLVMFMPIFLDAFSSGIARYVTAAYAAGDSEQVTRIASSMCMLNILVATVVLCGLGLAAWKIDTFLEISPERVAEARWMFLLLTGGTVIWLPVVPLNVGMHVRQRFLVSSAITVATTLLRSVLLCSLILGLGPKVLYVAVAQFVSGVFSHLATLACSLWLLPALRFSPAHVSFGAVWGILGFGVWSTLGRTADAIRQGADPLILNRFADATQVTSFHVGSLIDRQIRALLGMVVGPLEPIFTTLHAGAEDRRLAHVFLRLTRATLWLTIPLLVPLLVFRQEIMHLYLGPAFANYANAPSVMGLLLLTYPLFVTLHPLLLVARGRGLLGVFTRRVVLAQFLNLALTLLLVGGAKMAAIGSALATLLASLTYPAILWPTGCALAGVRYSAFVRAVAAGLLPGALAAGIAMLVRQAIPCDTLPRLVVACALTACLGWALTAPMLHGHDWRDIQAIGARLFGRRLGAQATG